VSPSVAAATALTGKLTAPADLETVPATHPAAPIGV
jgi:hypothetical protein